MKNIATIEFIYKSIVSIFDVSIIKALSLYAKSKHQFKEQVRQYGNEKRNSGRKETLRFTLYDILIYQTIIPNNDMAKYKAINEQDRCVACGQWEYRY